MQHAAKTVELLTAQKTHSKDVSTRLTFLLQGTFQCNKIFIEDKINLRAVGLEKSLQLLSFRNICGQTKEHLVMQTVTHQRTLNPFHNDCH